MWIWDRFWAFESPWTSEMTFRVIYRVGHNLNINNFKGQVTRLIKGHAVGLWNNFRQTADMGTRKGKDSQILFFSTKRCCIWLMTCFWHLGVRSAEHAEKVKSQIFAYCDHCDRCAYLHYFRSGATLPSLQAHGRKNAKTYGRKNAKL